jgi:uncharacterized hydantoinase/oxoprolinase family protein
MSVVTGWDVGGAHLEAARAEGGRIVAAIQIASPLWLGVSRLDKAFRTARSDGTRLCRPRAELGVREREPCGLPPEA